MEFKVAALPGQDRFGALVTDLDPASIANPRTRKALHDLWIDAGVIVFRGIAGGVETQIALSGIFGEPEIHELTRKRTDGHPLLVDIVYDPTRDCLYEVDGEVRGAWLPWHSDLIYSDRINRGGILRPVLLPERGGQTGFVDQIAAHARLSDEMQARIEGVNVIYRLNFDARNQKFGRPKGLLCHRMAERMQAFNRDVEGRSRVIHPLVFTQPETGRKVLNFSPWFAVGIEGMENEAGDALLERIARHATDPTGVYLHDWMPDDMVLWDNWRMMHCAIGVPADERRHMQRTTIAGDYALGRIETPAIGLSEATRVSI